MKLGFFINEGLRLAYILPPVTLAKYNNNLFRFIPYHPTAANILVTHNCNSRCQTCAMWRSKSSGELTTEEIVNIMAQLKLAGTRRISFSGGESTLRSDLPDLIKEAKRLDFKHILVASNGLSWNINKAQEYLKNGCNRVTISIDGIGEVHDKQRGIKGAYDKSMQTVMMLLNLRKNEYPDLDIELETTITRNNLSSFADVIKLCKELNVGWMLSVFENDSFQFKGVDSSNLKMDQNEEIVKGINQLHHSFRHYPLSPIISHVALERVKRYLIRENSYDLRSNIPCTAGFTAIYVDAVGNVFPGCWAMPSIGNIKEKTLREIISAHEFKERRKMMFIKKCPTCPNSILWGAWYYIPAILEESIWRLRFLTQDSQKRDVG